MSRWSNVGKGVKRAELSDDQLDSLKSFFGGGFLKKSIEDDRAEAQAAAIPVRNEQELIPMDAVSTEPAPMNPTVKEYLTKKIQEKKVAAQPVDREPSVEAPLVEPAAKAPSFMDKYSDLERQKALDASKEGNTEMAFAQLFGGIGDALARRSPAETAKRFADYRATKKDNTVGEFDRSKKAAIETYSTNRQIEQNMMTDAQRERDMDPNSEESKMAKALAVKMGMNPDTAKNLTAAKFKEVSPVLEKMYSVEQTKLARQDAAATRAEAKAQREYEKNQTLETTFGTARTADDAKQLKAAAETKAKFDRQLQELIDLRKDKGVEYLDRDAVARAKQLSRDLLLGYKDLAKLGVLSQSDEAILNDIIPKDPLGQDWAPGQDPTLHKLEKFQGDVESDFNSRLDQRLRDPNNPQRQQIQQSKKASSNLPKKVVQNGHTYILNEETGEYE
ncbi:hypothetical protein ACES2J_08370 [Bdellovibrio bacteriovorus]|uniref:hypothetical protein n=1 Tax=Bdellovibrio bacteriovorus TaxID=959 RepID=UPI0035A6D82A